LPAFSIVAITLGRLGSAPAFGVPNSVMSAPAEKKPGRPVSTTASTSASSRARCTSRTMPSRVA
jgi:hypothetical protein